VTSFADRLARGGAVLAPMAGFSDAPFRRLCREHGSAWAVTEMVSAKALAAGDERSLRLAAPYRGEPDLVIQLFAADPEEAAAAAVLLRERFDPMAFDLNMGCPVRKIVHKGCGVELMGRPERAARIVAAIRTATDRPVSVKMRLGRDRVELDEAADAAVAGGAALVSVHGRTGAQRYEGRADWTRIGALAARLPVPVLGSGDVADAAAAAARRALGVGVMVGRGALGRPWLFAQLRGAPAPSWPEAAAVLLRHVRLQVAWYGEVRGVRALRGHLARYVAPWPEAAGLRPALVRVERADDVARILAPLLPDGVVPEAREARPDRASMTRSPARSGAGGPLV
jgi:nifR3 family TIM-barrel protein